MDTIEDLKLVNISKIECNGYGRVKIIVNTAQEAKTLMTSSKGLRPFIPQIMLYRFGIIRGIPLSMPEHDIISKAFSPIKIA